ncbi:hypothetical protein K438DRAFT_1758764 [Mycena galopus ATCC 62051]|nr:hypothetical protein K438DRAFT_1758764 [Mycena galopus ATCC 62051]
MASAIPHASASVTTSSVPLPRLRDVQNHQHMPFRDGGDVRPGDPPLESITLQEQAAPATVHEGGAPAEPKAHGNDAERCRCETHLGTENTLRWSPSSHSYHIRSASAARHLASIDREWRSRGDYAGGVASASGTELVLRVRGRHPILRERSPPEPWRRQRSDDSPETPKHGAKISGDREWRVKNECEILTPYPGRQTGLDFWSLVGITSVERSRTTTTRIMQSAQAPADSHVPAITQQPKTGSASLQFARLPTYSDWFSSWFS